MPYVRKPFKLNDGTAISIQASVSHYSTPRNDIGPYTEFEVWPDVVVSDWIEYSTGRDGEGPYAYVPIEKIKEFVVRHGGFVFEDVLQFRSLVY